MRNLESDPEYEHFQDRVLNRRFSDLKYTLFRVAAMTWIQRIKSLGRGVQGPDPSVWVHFAEEFSPEGEDKERVQVFDFFLLQSLTFSKMTIEEVITYD